jgi:hypothetical protein
MELQTDTIIDIKENQVRYFGGPGKMLLPSIATVAALIKEIPRHHLITTDSLRKVLADRFNVQGTCPVTTKKALQAIANDPRLSVPYWRVVKKNGELMAYYPGGVAGHAALLKEEKFTINTEGGKSKVANFKGRLVQLGFRN